MKKRTMRRKRRRIWRRRTSKTRVRTKTKQQKATSKETKEREESRTGANGADRINTPAFPVGERRAVLSSARSLAFVLPTPDAHPPVPQGHGAPAQPRRQREAVAVAGRKR